MTAATSLQQLEQRSAQLAQQFRVSYEQFLAAFGLALEQQLIQVCFQICTQIQPDHFLALEDAAQEKLLCVLRDLARDSRGQCALEPLLELAREQAETGASEAAEDQDAWEAAEEQPSEDSAPGDSDAEAETAAVPEPIDVGVHAGDEGPAEAAPELELTYLTPTPPAHPMAIHAWRQALDRALEALLKQVSRQGNVILDQARVLRNPLPLAVLQAAIIQGRGESAQAPANVLRLVLQSGTDEAAETDAEPIQVVAIQLRLGDLAMASPGLAEAQRKIRDLQQQLRQLGHLVRQAERRSSVQQAELRWRLAWPQE